MDKEKQIRFVPLTAMWSEDNELFIRVKERVGLYYFQIDEDTYLDFLADVYHPDNENGRVFRCVGIRKGKDEHKKHSH